MRRCASKWTDQLASTTGQPPCKRAYAGYRGDEIADTLCDTRDRYSHSQRVGSVGRRRQRRHRRQLDLEGLRGRGRGDLGRLADDLEELLVLLDALHELAVVHVAGDRDRADRVRARDELGELRRRLVGPEPELDALERALEHALD